MLGYDTQGDHETHRAEATVILTYAGVDATPDQIVICTVAQHTVTSELMTVFFPRDTLAVETVTYSAIKDLAQELGLRLEALTMDWEGVVPDAFERLCQTRPPKVLYCRPTLHPPTATMSSEHRQTIVDIARRYRAVPDGGNRQPMDSKRRRPGAYPLAPHRSAGAAEDYEGRLWGKR